MAIIFTYPTKATPALTDTVVITDSESEDPEDRTKQISIASIKDTINVVDSLNALTGAVTITGGTKITLNTSGNNIEINNSGVGTGTVNKITKWSASGSDIENSIITEDPGGPGITIAGNVSVASGSYISTPSILDGSGEFGSANQVLSIGADGSSIEWASNVDGSGTTNKIPMWSDSNTLTNSTAVSGLTTTVTGAVELYYAGVKKFETTATGSTLTGNVGIGISIPDDKLHVVGNIRVASTSPIIKFDETDTTDENWALINSGGTMTIRTSDDAFSSYDTKVTIKQDGKVGIGETNLTSILQVVGLAEYADNTTAGAAGLTVGAFYRTGDFLKVVH